MRRSWPLVALALTALACGVTGDMDSKVYDLSWRIAVTGVPAGAREAKLWIAVPQERQEQKVSDLRVDTGYDWKPTEDPDFHNRAVLVTVPNPPDSFSVSLSARVRRFPVEAPEPASLSSAERPLYLRDEGMVSLSPRIRALADSIGGGDRARYDYVRTVMTYDKTVPGWGRGDSERACDVHKGNCTDFHSLFMSLSRAEGVPARFEMGYATLPGGETDRAGGYHCWAWFYRDGAWVPVDISEGNLNPDRAGFYFGHLDADRVAFSTGRDVKFPEMQGPPLNYFPAAAYVEVDGRPFDGVTRRLTYRTEGEKGGAAQVSVR